MTGTGRRPGQAKVLATGVATAVVLVLAGGIAFACTALTTLTANPTTAEAGSAVNVRGEGFSAGAGAAPVKLHWNGPSGALLGTTVAEENGEFRTTVTVPAGVANGNYIISAAQASSSNPELSRVANAELTVGTPAPAPTGSGVVTTQPPAAQPAPAVAPVPAAQQVTAPAAAAAPAPTPAATAGPTRRAATAPAQTVAAPTTPDTTPAAPAPATTPAPAAPAPAVAAPAPPQAEERPTPAPATRVSTSGNGGPSPWLIPMILLGVALAVASAAVVAKDSRRRRAEPAMAEINPPA